MTTTCELRMPADYVQMDDDEMEYVEGGKLLATRYVSRSTCQSVYQAMRYYNGWCQGLATYVAGKLNPYVGFAIQVVNWSFNYAKSTFQKGGYYSGYRGVKLYVYDNGIPSAVAY